MTDDLRALLDAAPLVVEPCVYGEGDLAFSVEIQHVDKPTIEAIGTAAMKTIRDRRGQERREPNLDAFRRALRDHCVRGWDGLTLGKLFGLCGKRAPAGTELETVVPCTPHNVILLLERARTTIDGTPVSFDEWVFDQASRAAEIAAAEDAAAKNG